MSSVNGAAKTSVGARLRRLRIAIRLNSMTTAAPVRMFS
jgi:hypothetical protein